DADAGFLRPGRRGRSGPRWRGLARRGTSGGAPGGGPGRDRLAALLALDGFALHVVGQAVRTAALGTAEGEGHAMTPETAKPRRLGGKKRSGWRRASAEPITPYRELVEQRLPQVPESELPSR